MKANLAATCVIVLSLMSLQALGREFYVATDGVDDYGRSGGLSDPYASLQFATWNGAGEGDTIYLRGGEYQWTDSQWIDRSSSGTENAPLHIRPYNTESVTLDGSAMSDNSLLVINSSHTIIEGLAVRNSRKSGISVWGGAPGDTETGVSHVTIRNNVIHSSQEAGIFIGHGLSDMTTTQQITIEGNTVYHNCLSNEAHTSSGGWASAISSSQASHVQIRDNTVYENHGEGIGLCLTDQATVSGNEVHDNYGVNLYIDNSTNTRHEKNFVYSTGNADYYRDFHGQEQPAAGIQIANEDEGYDFANPSKDNEIVNNIFVNNRSAFRYGDYQAGGGLDQILFACNTIYGASESVLHIDDVDSGTHNAARFVNNIFQRAGGEGMTEIGSPTDGLDFEHNLWHDVLPELIAQDAADLLTDPRFRQPGGLTPLDYLLLADSLAWGEGVALPEVLDDFFGTLRTGNNYLGASATIPEPASIFILCLGSVGLCTKASKRTRPCG